MSSLSPFETFLSEQNVSRETFDRFALYQDMLLKWQKKVNLISDTTIGDIATRHFLDSAQIVPYIYKESKIFDLGSGAGFPGMVLALLGFSDVTLVESDRKKCEFLKNVSRETKCPVRVINDRVETIKEKADVITSRALASLSQLLDWSEPLVHEKTYCLFHKGKNYSKELEDAGTTKCFTWNILPSKTDKDAVILKITRDGGKNA